MVPAGSQSVSVSTSVSESVQNVVRLSTCAANSPAPHQAPAGCMEPGSAGQADCSVVVHKLQPESKRSSGFSPVSLNPDQLCVYLRLRFFTLLSSVSLPRPVPFKSTSQLTAQFTPPASLHSELSALQTLFQPHLP